MCIRDSAQGVQWFTDALAISAEGQIKDRRQQEWIDHLEAWMDDPVAEANHMVMGMDLEQRREARGSTKSHIHTWI